MLEKGAPAPRVKVALKAGGERVVQAKSVILATGAGPRLSRPSASCLTAIACGPIVTP